MLVIVAEVYLIIRLDSSIRVYLMKSEIVSPVSSLKAWDRWLLLVKSLPEISDKERFPPGLALI